MSDSWDDRRKAQEESYFDKVNKQALERLALKKQEAPRISPVSGKPMEQFCALGVVLDRCSETGGVWFDSGELEQVAKNLTTHPEKLGEFLSMIKGK
jgi:hypothetical protein